MRTLTSFNARCPEEVAIFFRVVPPAITKERNPMQSSEPALTVIQPKLLHKEYRRPIQEILTDLAKPIPPRLLAQRKQGGVMLTYIPWYFVVRLLDYYTPGWQGQVISITPTSDRIFLVYRLTLQAAEGKFTREATGTELLKEWSQKKQELRELAFGDPSSNAESMAFRRAAAKFGLGLSLYEKE